MLLHVPGRVGMEECSLHLIFQLEAARPFGFLVGAVFFQQMKLDYFRQF